MNSIDSINGMTHTEATKLRRASQNNNNFFTNRFFQVRQGSLNKRNRNKFS